MTIIVAIHRDGETWVGSDRQRNGGYCLVMDKSKFVIRDGWAIGVTGWARVCDIIENAKEPLPPGPFDLSCRLRDMIEADGFHRIPIDGEENLVKNFGTGFVIANDRQVWDLDAGFALSPIAKGDMHAKGSGAAYALGAFYALDGFGWSVLAAVGKIEKTYDLVSTAVEAAIAHDTGCGGKPFVMKLGNPR